MSAPDSSHDKISISFTGLLYGVVIDAALHRFEEFRLTPANLLLLISLLIVIQDFFFYHLDLKDIGSALESSEEAAKTDAEKRGSRRKKGKKERKIFLLDILVLGAWFLLALSAREGQVLTYLFFLTIFFTAVSIWEFFVPLEGGGRRLLYTHAPVAAFSALVTVGDYFFLKTATVSAGAAPRALSDWSWVEWAFLFVPLVFFLAWRLLYWFGDARNRLRDEEEPGPEVRDVEHHTQAIKASLASLTTQVEGVQQLATQLRDSLLSSEGQLPQINSRLDQLGERVARAATTEGLVQLLKDHADALNNAFKAQLDEIGRRAGQAPQAETAGNGEKDGGD